MGFRGRNRKCSLKAQYHLKIKEKKYFYRRSRKQWERLTSEARRTEALSFWGNWKKRKMQVCVRSALSHVRLFATPAVAFQAPLSREFSRQAYWSVLSLLTPGEKGREFQKNIYFCFIDYAKPFDCVDHRKLENPSRERNTLPAFWKICMQVKNQQLWNNRLVQNWERRISKLYVVTLVI